VDGNCSAISWRTGRPLRIEAKLGP
jgi:hypothetical protein